MLELQSTTLSSLGTAILAMIAVCVLFIADSTIVFWVVFAMISMDIGIAGYLSLWGADLDPTTVVNILVCITFIQIQASFKPYMVKFHFPGLHYA